MTTDVVYLAFVLAALAVFRWRPPAQAVLLVFLGGWLVLPVGHFPPGAADAEFPYWITGLAVPSDMLLTKAWVAPAAALLGLLVFDRSALLRLRPVWMDAPVLLWCAWPLLQSALVEHARPAGVWSSLYLAGCWGLPWLLGRACFASPDAKLLLVKGLALAGLACLPVSLVEGVFGPTLYGLVYEPHPFRLDGIVRYVGFRPLGFFEDGNQFGLWVSLCALAAVWLALVAPAGREARRWRVVAGVDLLIALAAQSVGAILLLAVGAGFLAACRLLRPRLLLAAALGLLVLGGAVYVSGAVPIAKIGKETALGRHVIAAFRSVGRGSFTWRIGQDQKLLPQAMATPVVGTATWDWWRPQGIRPWGLTLLVLGQFGAVGLLALLGTLLAPALAAAWRAPPGGAWRLPGVPLALAAVVGMTVLDALMNSFVFFPAVLAAGALAAATPVTAPRRVRGEITRIRRRPAT
jgi:hypothetical protein